MGTFVPATDATGWSSYTGAPPATIFYISKAAGASDSNNGTAPTFTSGTNGPFSTLTRGLNALNALSAGTEAWLLVREGDTWTSEDFGNLTLSGPSSSNPVVISSYHTSVPNTFHPAVAPRPLLRPAGNQNVLRFRGNNVAFIGFDIFSYTRNPSDVVNYIPGQTGTSGLWSVESNTSVRIEGCSIRFCGEGISFGDAANGITIHRCAVSDNYIDNAGNGRGSGLLAQWINSTISDCVCDTNGWNPSVPGTFSWSIYNRSLYIASYDAPWAQNPFPSGPTTLKNSIVSNDGSGSQLRAGGTVTNNLFARNPYGLNIGLPTSFTSDVSRNVVLHAKTDPNGAPPNEGIYVFGPSQGDDSTIGTAFVHDNILAHTLNAASSAIVLDKGMHDSNINNNIIYQWVTASSPIASFTGSLKTIGSFGAITGGSGYTPGAIFSGQFGSTFTGTGSGTNITVTGISGYLTAGANLVDGSGDLLPFLLNGDNGDDISGVGVPGGTTIVAQSSGTLGSNGTYVAGSFDAIFTGSGSGTNLTATVISGTIRVADIVVGTGVPANTTISSQTSGVYVTSNATTSSGALITCSNGATFTGTGSGTNMTATGITGLIRPGDTITGTGVPASTTISSQTSGVYVTNNTTTSSGRKLKAYIPVTITSSGAAINATSRVLNTTSVTSGGLYTGQVVAGNVALGTYLGITGGCVIVSQLTGPLHGVGTYYTDIQLVKIIGPTALSTKTWYNVPMTGGSGTGVTGNITVENTGAVSAVEIYIGVSFENPVGGSRCGSGFVVGPDNLSATPSAPFYTNPQVFGGFSNSTGSGFSVHIDATAINTIGTNPIDALGYPFPNRTVETYDSEVLGGPGTFAHFIGLAKANCKFNWDTRYTANAVNTYIRAGFGIYAQVQRLSLRLHV